MVDRGEEMTLTMQGHGYPETENNWVVKVLGGPRDHWVFSPRFPQISKHGAPTWTQA